MTTKLKSIKTTHCRIDENKLKLISPQYYATAITLLKLTTPHISQIPQSAFEKMIYVHRGKADSIVNMFLQIIMLIIIDKLYKFYDHPCISTIVFRLHPLVESIKTALNKS
jgi:hypothetical protein